MNITEIRITLGKPSELPVCAYCSVSFDDSFVVHDLRLLQRGDRIFLAMPNRKRTVSCHVCGFKNAMQASYCNQCGSRQLSSPQTDSMSPSDRYADVAHPLRREFRDFLESKVLDQYMQTLDTSDCSGSAGHGIPDLTRG